MAACSRVVGSSSFIASSVAGVVGGRANLQADRNGSHLFGCL